MHNALLAAPDSIGVAPWEWFAKRASLRDSVAFARCMTSAEPIPTLAKDTIDGRKLKIRGTPLLLIGKLRLEGAPTLDSLKAYIARAH